MVGYGQSDVPSGEGQLSEEYLVATSGWLGTI